MDDRRRDTALFRYSLIREAADARLSHRDRGELVRSLAAGEHLGPGGEPVRVSRDTLDRWIRAWVRHEAPCIRAEMKGLRRRSVAAGG